MTTATADQPILPATSETTAAATERAASVTDAVFDRATSWVVIGLQRSRAALRKTSYVLSRAAERLGRIASDLEAAPAK